MKQRVSTWAVVIVVPIGLLLVAIPGLWVFMSVTATPLHPNENSVPTMMQSEPMAKWTGPVKQGRQAVRSNMAEQSLPGVSVAVGIQGDVVWAEGFGFADLTTSAPVTPEHKFRIGTASTVLTSAGAGLLLEQGRLKLDEEIQRYVPAFPKKQWPLTLRQLMGHTSGIITDSGDEGPLFAKHCDKPVEALPNFSGSTLRFQPGTQYRYSSYGWILVSQAVEAAANQPFLTFMQKEVFDPLGLRETIPDSARVEGGEDFPLVNMVRELIYDPEAKRKATPQPKKAPAQDRVTAYFPRFAADPKYGLHLMRPLDYSCYSGASVFVSTPSDLVRFGMAMNSGKLLKPATAELLQTSQRLASGAETGSGLGWYLKSVSLGGKSARVIGQDGYILGGMVASLITIPENGLAIAVTSNISYADTYSLAVKIAEAFVGQAASAGP